VRPCSHPRRTAASEASRRLEILSLPIEVNTTSQTVIEEVCITRTAGLVRDRDPARLGLLPSTTVQPKGASDIPEPTATTSPTPDVSLAEDERSESGSQSGFDDEQQPEFKLPVQDANAARLQQNETPRMSDPMPTTSSAKNDEQSDSGSEFE
jgi:hypothetical protein